MTDNAPTATARPPFKGDGLSTLIGSLPVRDHQEGLGLIFAHTPAIPLWPQLPSNPLEGMMRQFIEGLPGIVEGEERTYIDTGSDHFEGDLLAFFEEYLTVCDEPSMLAGSRFAVSEKRAGGLYRLREAVPGKSAVRAVKGQITGPFTLLTGLTDTNKKLGYYDPAFREMAVKGLAAKAAWQVRFLKELGLPVIVFIDEPALAGLGSSSFISLAMADLAQDLGEVITAIQDAGGLAGIHVCANTDWEFLLSLGLDILSFDAYGFFDRLASFKPLVHAFLERDGIIAWGGIPTSEGELIRKECAESLTALWESHADLLASDRWTRPALLGQTLITPSCGTGSLAPDLALRVLELTRDVSRNLRDKYPPAA
ncbi:MAG: hypothetical protein OEV91_11635 [Desulfobulbaceae bacterium]|nr:hypothetical protein [Desulfobulbaceae bacterium]